MYNSYVTNSVVRLRKKLQNSSDKEQARVEEYQDAIDAIFALFMNQVKRGEIKIKDLSDFERLLKLSLLLMNRPTEKIEHSTDIEEVEFLEQTLENLEDDEALQKLIEHLSDTMNERNEGEH